MLHCIVEQVSNRLNLRGEDNISFRLEEIQQLVQEAEESRKSSKNQDKKYCCILLFANGKWGRGKLPMSGFVFKSSH